MNNPNVRLTRALAMAIGAAALCGAAFSQTSGPPIVVGAVLSLTGPLAIAGLPERDGLQLAVKRINRTGGVKGRALEVIVEDDASSPDTAISKANNLIFSRNVKVLLGATGIGPSVAIGGLTASLKLPQIAYSGLGPPVERERTCVFHLTPAQELNARGLLEYATKVLKAKRIGVLHDSGFGQSVFNSLQQLAAEYGVEYVAVEKFELAATDATTQAAKVRAAKPDAVLVVASGATAFRSVRQVKITVPVIAAHPSAPYDVVKAMGDGSAGVIFADFVVGEDPLPHQVGFVESFRKEYGRYPKNFDAAGYDSVFILAQALDKAGLNATNEQLCAAMRTPFQGVMTAYDFAAADMGGLKVSNFVYSKFVDGKFIRLPFRSTN